MPGRIGGQERELLQAMKMKVVASSLLALTLAVAGVAASHAQQGPPPPAGWDRVPNNYTTDIEKRAYREGIDGARKDQGNGRRPSVVNRDEYNRPDFPVPPRMFRTYQRAFRAGYQRGVQMFYGGRRY